MVVVTDPLEVDTGRVLFMLVEAGVVDGTEEGTSPATPEEDPLCDVLLPLKVPVVAEVVDIVKEDTTESFDCCVEVSAYDLMLSLELELKLE